MNNVSRLLLARAEKAERVLATMVKANDFIEEVCDQEIASLMDRITEMEREHDEIRHKAYDDGFKDGQAKVTELQSELDDLHNRYGLNDEEPYIEDEDGTIAHMRMLERQAEEACERDRVLYGPVPHD